MRDEISALFSNIRGGPPRTTRGLWLSRIDGSVWRLIGMEQFPEKDAGRLRSVRLTPDDKHVSYLFGNGLYSVPLPNLDSK